MRKNVMKIGILSKDDHHKRTIAITVVHRLMGGRGINKDGQDQPRPCPNRGSRFRSDQEKPSRAVGYP